MTESTPNSAGWRSLPAEYLQHCPKYLPWQAPTLRTVANSNLYISFLCSVTAAAFSSSHSPPSLTGASLNWCGKGRSCSSSLPYQSNPTCLSLLSEWRSGIRWTDRPFVISIISVHLLTEPDQLCLSLLCPPSQALPTGKWYLEHSPTSTPSMLLPACVLEEAAGWAAAGSGALGQEHEGISQPLPPPCPLGQKGGGAVLFSSLVEASTQTRLTILQLPAAMPP